MFYNIDMIDIFDLGFFLNKVFPKRIKDYSRDKFLDDLFFGLINDLKLRDKNGITYFFSRELASRLFSNRVDLPRVIQKAILDSVFNNESYISNAEKAFNRSIGKINIKRVCDETFIVFKSSQSFDIQYAKTIEESVKATLYYKALWQMLCAASLISNRRGMKPLRQQGRPRKIRTRDSFFYLSQNEKEKRADYFIGFLCNENNHLNMEHLKELLEILVYCGNKISQRIKQVISFNFLKNWNHEKGISDLDGFIECFDDAKRTFPNRANRLDGWETPAERAYVKLTISKIKKAIESATKANDYLLASKLLYNTILSNS